MGLENNTIGTLTESIKNIVESSISESFIETILKRLDSFGCSLTESDVFAIGFSVQKVEQTIKNECNTSDIPRGLICHAVDMVCGEFLLSKYRTGQLNLASLDLDGALKSVTVGGAQVSFNNDTSDEGKLNTLISLLVASGKGQFACYRQIKW